MKLFYKVKIILRGLAFSVRFLGDHAYAFRIFEKGYAQGFSFALPQLNTNIIQNLLTLRKELTPVKLSLSCFDGDFVFCF